MAIKITSVESSLKNNGLKILIHGLAGAGKTVMCATTGAPTLIISAEAGLLSIAGAPDYIKTAVVNTIDELEEAYDYLEQNPDEFEWVCIDSISEVAEVLLAQEKATAKDPRQAYGNLQDRMLKILRSFRDLNGMNVVMSCKQQRQVDDDSGVTKFIPMLPGKGLTNSIGYLFDEVFALRVEKDDDGEDYRTVQTGRDRNYEAKDRSGLLDMFEEPSIKRIAAKIRGESAKNSVEPEDVSEISEVIDDRDGEKLDNTALGIIENNTDSVMYLFHNDRNEALELEIGESIDDDGFISAITQDEFDHYKANQSN